MSDLPRWKVVITKRNDCIEIGFERGQWTIDPPRLVYPPNFIERLLGITYEKKFNRVKQWAERYCDELNEKLDKIDEVVSE